MLYNEVNKNTRGGAMYKLCKTEQSAKRQREIENCLLELLLTKHYEDITITEICDKMNMPRKSFYRYFDGKEGVKQSLINHTMMDYNTVKSVVNKRDSVTIRDEFQAFFEFWKEHKDMLVALDRSGLIGNLFDTTVSLAMTEYDRVRTYLSDSYADDKQAAYRFVISGLMTMMIDWYRGGFKESVDTMAGAMVKIITRPLFENLSRTE